MPIVLKVAVTAVLIVAISEVAKRSDRLGAILAALPMVTVLAMLWMHFEGQGDQKIGAHAYYTFWYVVPTLPMFLVMPVLLEKGFHFWAALGVYVVGTALLFFAFAKLVKQFGIELL